MFFQVSASKKRHWLTLGIIAALCIAHSLPAKPSQDTSGSNNGLPNFIQVANKTIPAVVSIETRGSVTRTPYSTGPESFNEEFFRRFFGAPSRPAPEEEDKSAIIGRGSGCLIHPEGYIITNFHVVRNASTIYVKLNDNRIFEAQIIGSDPKTDLALIKIEEHNSAFPYLELGNSDDLQVGEWVAAIGNPLGLQASLTVGVISATGRNNLHISELENFIQTDAAINPGNSGGPLVNLNSEVIGINAVIATNTGGYMGVGFAIPSNMAKQVVDQLRTTGVVSRNGYLGITLQPINHDLAQALGLDTTDGVLVTHVIAGSPSDEAGIKQGDIVLKYDGKPIKGYEVLRNAILLTDPGQSMVLTINREGKIMKIKVTIGSRPSPALAAKVGLEVEELNFQLAQSLGYSETKGIIVKSVRNGSPAMIAGIEAGSLILSINRKQVETLAEFTKVLEEASQSKVILFLIKQQTELRYVPIRIEK